MNDESRLCALHDRMESEQEKQWSEIDKRLPGNIFFWAFGLAFGILIAIQGLIYQQTSEIKVCIATMGVTVSSTEKGLENHLREWNRYRGRIDREVKQLGNERDNN